jgi:DNA repair protein RadC
MLETDVPGALTAQVHCREDCRSWPVTRLLGAVLCSEPAAEALLTKFGSLDVIADAGSADLVSVPGIGRRRATQVFAAFELARRTTIQPIEAKPIIESEKDVVRLVAPVLQDQKREMFLVLLLNTRHRLLKLETVSVGSLSASIVHPREVFRSAIQAAAAAMILAHNHPSGDPQPSDDDIEITLRLRDAGQTIGIEVLDHVIVSAGGKHMSFRKSGVF